jgi:hypothetical protein
MKVLVFRIGKGNRKYKGIRKSSSIGFERLLFFLSICAFFVLLMVQAAMFNPSLRTFIVRDNALEGKPLEIEEYLYSEGRISIALCSGEPDENLKVLVNGTEVAAFINNVIELKVKNMDVIEIDGSVVEDAEVEVISASNNITGDGVGKRIQINSEMKKLMTIIIE